MLVNMILDEMAVAMAAVRLGKCTLTISMSPTRIGILRRMNGIVLARYIHTTFCKCREMLPDAGTTVEALVAEPTLANAMQAVQ